MRAAIVVLLLLVSACSSEGGKASGSRSTLTPSPSGVTPTPTPTPTPALTSTPAPTPTATRAQRTGTRIQLHASAFGRILFDSSGQAIYVFDVEVSHRPRCYGACAAAWPPVLTRGEPVALGGVDQDLLGTTKRRNGSTQVTYAGHPLYFYAHEGKYEVKCHDVFENGGRWYAVQADGTRAP